MASILLVDDENSIRITIAEFLKRVGHDVLSASSLLQATEILKTNNLDVALLDILLGPESGLDVARLIRECQPNVQLVFMTGEPETVSAREALHLHAFDYLAKPVGKQQIIDIVEQAVAEKARLDDYDRMQADLEEYRQNLERQVSKQNARLKESEKRYRELVEDLRVVIFEIAQDGRIVYVNPTVERMLGYKPHDVLGSMHLPLIYPDDQCKVEGSFLRIIGGESDSLEFRIMKSNGDACWVSATSLPIRDQDNNVIGVRGVLTDMSDHKQMEDMLRISEQQKSLILNSMTDLVTYYDPGLTIIWANRAAGESVGQDPEALTGRHCYDIWGRRSDPCPDCPVLKARDTGLEYEAETETPDGRHWNIRGLPVKDDTNKVIGMIEVTHKIKTPL